MIIPALPPLRYACRQCAPGVCRGIHYHQVRKTSYAWQMNSGKRCAVIDSVCDWRLTPSSLYQPQTVRRIILRKRTTSPYQIKFPMKERLRAKSRPAKLPPQPEHPQPQPEAYAEPPRTAPRSSQLDPAPRAIAAPTPAAAVTVEVRRPAPARRASRLSHC